LFWSWFSIVGLPILGFFFFFFLVNNEFNKVKLKISPGKTGEMSP